jgi:hypothetical protein
VTGTAHILFRMAYSPDGKCLAASAGSQNNTGALGVCDAATGKEALRLRGATDAEHGQPAHAVRVGRQHCSSTTGYYRILAGSTEFPRMYSHAHGCACKRPRNA